MIHRRAPALPVLLALGLIQPAWAAEQPAPAKAEAMAVPAKAETASAKDKVAQTAAGGTSAQSKSEIRIEVLPEEARPGDPVAVRVHGTERAPTGTLGKSKLRFFPYADGHIAFTSLPIETKTGVRKVRVKVRSHPAFESELRVVPAEWRTRKLSVSKSFTEKRSEELQARIVADREAFAKAQGGKISKPHFTQGFALPCDSAFTAFFGDRRTFNGQLKSRHYGLDLNGAVGDPIHAANDGVVVLVRDAFFSGNSVIIDHGGGVFTLYFHLSAFDVAEGDRVKRGQLIGKIGSTGRVTGPHLHWSVKIANRYVDPQRLVELALD